MDTSLSDLAKKLLKRQRAGQMPATVLPDPTRGEVSYDDSPVPEAELAAADAGTARPVPAPRPPAVARAPQELPGEVSPELAPIIASLGAVADRAQARMDAPPPPSSGGSRLAGFMSSAAQSAAMGAGSPRQPLVSPEEKSAAVREYVTAKRAQDELPGDADLKDAQRRSNLAELNANLGEAGATIGAAIGRTKPDVSFYERLRQGARQPVVDAEKRSAEVRAYVEKKRAGDQKFAQDATANELEREKLRLAGQPKPKDPLEEEKTRAEIAKLNAETEKAGRRGGGVDPLAQRKRELELKKLENEVGGNGTAPVSPKQRQQIAEIQERHANILDNIKALEDQINKSGTYEMFGPESGDMERRLNNIATDMAKLTDPESVARSSEVEGFRKGLFQPGLFTQNDTAKESLKHFRDEIDKRLQTAYRIRGIDPAAVGGGAQPAVQPGKATPSGKPYARKQHNPKLGRTRFLDAAGNVVEEANGLL
jgi:hypothetical protein